MLDPNNFQRPVIPICSTLLSQINGVNGMVRVITEWEPIDAKMERLRSVFVGDDSGDDDAYAGDSNNPTKIENQSMIGPTPYKLARRV
jgi:hypothetical protein